MTQAVGTEPVPHDRNDEPFDVYDRWNAAIGAHFFSAENAGSLVRLSFDTQVAETVGRGFDGSVRALCRAIHSLIQPEDGEEAFAFLEGVGASGEFRPLALLAVQVLAASHMGEDPEADVKRFWPIFFGLVEHELSQRQIERLSLFWFECERFYREDLQGSLGMLTLPPDATQTPLIGKRHINLPLWQCTLREADKEQLKRRFQVSSAQELRAEPDQLPALARNWPELNRTLKNTLRWAADNPMFEREIGDLLADIRDQARETAFAADNRKRVASRIRLAGLRRLSCYLQTRTTSGQWLDAGPQGNVTALAADQVLYGVDASAFGASWRGGSRIAFLNAGSEGFTMLRGALSGAANVVLLFANGSLPQQELIPPELWTARHLSEELADEFTALQGRLDPENDAALASYFDVEFVRSRPFILDGGLPLKRRDDGIFLIGAPPRIRILTKTGDHVLIDRTSIAVPPDGLVRLPADLTGKHVVAYGDDALELDFVPVPESENDEADEIGWLLDPHGRMEITTPDDQGTMLVGADLRVP